MRRAGYLAPAALLLVLCLAATALYAEAPVKVHRKTTEPRTVAYIKHKGPYTDMPAVIQQLQTEVDRGGYHVCGPLMVVLYSDPGQTKESELTWDVRVPVTNPGSMLSVDNDKLGFGLQDPAYVAYTYHVGQRETIRESYALLLDWARSNTYDITGSMTELHWSPQGARNPVIEVWLPVREKTPAERAFR